MMLAKEVNRLGFLIDGAARDTSSGRYFDIYNPSTGEVIAQVPDCSEAEVDAAVASAPMKRVRREKIDTWDGMLGR